MIINDLKFVNSVKDITNDMISVFFVFTDESMLETFSCLLAVVTPKFFSTVLKENLVFTVEGPLLIVNQLDRETIIIAVQEFIDSTSFEEWMEIYDRFDMVEQDQEDEIHYENNKNRIRLRSELEDQSDSDENLENS